MRLEMGLDTRLALQQKLVLAPQILQSIEILQMANVNLLEFVEEQLQENEALERDVPDEIQAPATKAEETAEDARLPTEADAAPTYAYEPEEWDELKSRRYDGEDGDKKYEALQNSPGRADTAQDMLADQLGLIEA